MSDRKLLLEQDLDMIEAKIDRLMAIVEAQQEMIQKNARTIQMQEQKLEKTKKELGDFIENVRYEVTDNKGFEQRYWYPKIMDHQLTMQQIVTQHKSYARFTETEFDMLIKYRAQSRRLQYFEESQDNIKLRERLLQGLKEENDKLLVALPDFFGSLDQYEVRPKKAFRAYLTEERRISLMELLPQHKNYHDAIMMHPNDYNPVKSGIATLDRYRMLTAIWAGKKVVVVAPQKSYITKQNRLFESVASMEEIEVPMMNALQSYDRIFSQCKTYSKDVVFLVAAGPMGVALVIDLSRLGYQAIDVGTLGKHYIAYNEDMFYV